MIDITNLTPPKQAILVFAAGLSIMGGALLLDKTGLMEMDRLFPWTVATGLLLFFGLFNSLSSLQSDSFAKYWGVSMYSYLGLAVAFGLAAWLSSGVPIGEAESYKFIYLVVTFGFLVFLSMVNLMKNIVNFAEREEWSQPRRKK
jgi:drug/metabolite transporter (DMT)-like permease